MKKSVILMIGVIYILAIATVGFLGLKMKVYDEQKYVETITCLTEGYKEYTENESGYKNGLSGHIDLVYSDGLIVEIKCDAKPDNATNKKLVYTVTSNPSVYEIITNADGTASVKFYSAGTAIVTIKASDNRGVSIKIKINVIDMGGII